MDAMVDQAGQASLREVSARVTAKWPKTTFVESIGEAIATAKELAGNSDVSIASTTIIQQAVDLGLVDEVAVSHSRSGAVRRGKVLLFGDLRDGHLMLEDPTVVEGRGAPSTCGSKGDGETVAFPQGLSISEITSGCGRGGEV